MLEIFVETPELFASMLPKHSTLLKTVQPESTADIILNKTDYCPKTPPQLVESQGIFFETRAEEIKESEAEAYFNIF